jgi:iron(III) transport system permease protein
MAILASREPWIVFLRSVVSALVVALASVLVGVPLGLLLGCTDVRGRKAALILHAFPMFLPPFLLALGWFYLFGKSGLWGGSQHTSDALFSLGGSVAVEALAFAPVVTSLVALAMQNVDLSLVEAARVAARPWRVATRILLPLAWPAAALGALVVFALSLSELGVPMFLRVRAYSAAVFARLGAVQYAPGEALVLTLPMLILSAALLVLERRLIGPRSFSVLGLHTAKATILPLGRWRLLATTIAWVGVLATPLPLVGLAWRAGAGIAALQDWIGSGVQNSIVPAAIAATLLTGIAVVLGRAIALRRPAAAALDALTVLAFVTPAAVLGVGLIGVWNRPATQPIYGTLAIIVIGFIARYAVLPTRTFMIAVAHTSPHLEESAAVEGAWFLRRLLRIVVPLHARTIAAAWLLAFVFCLRDLETTILFYPAGSAPLTVRIITLEANGREPIVAALALVHVSVVAAALVFGALAVRPRKAA